jgi:hypothetical protein
MRFAGEVEKQTREEFVQDFLTERKGNLDWYKTCGYRCVKIALTVIEDE